MSEIGEKRHDAVLTGDALKESFRYKRNRARAGFLKFFITTIISVVLLLFVELPTWITSLVAIALMALLLLTLLELNAFLENKKAYQDHIEDKQKPE